jgi:hypothetical protein
MTVPGAPQFAGALGIDRSRATLRPFAVSGLVTCIAGGNASSTQLWSHSGCSGRTSSSS